MIGKYLLIAITFIVIMAFSAWAKTWGKTDIEIRIHINEQLVRESTFGESPTFAIWIEDSNSGETNTIFATRRVAEDDWEGKAGVPVALPKWSGMDENEKSLDIDAASGATPEPGYFIKRVNVIPGSKWTVWIEVNLAGDYNEYYQEYNEELKQEDEFSSGQPALLYKAEIEANEGVNISPGIIGICLLDKEDGKIIQPVHGITSAADIFDEISLKVVRPKPRILKNRK